MQLYYLTVILENKSPLNVGMYAFFVFIPRMIWLAAFGICTGYLVYLLHENMLYSNNIHPWHLPLWKEFPLCSSLLLHFVIWVPTTGQKLRKTLEMLSISWQFPVWVLLSDQSIGQTLISKTTAISDQGQTAISSKSPWTHLGL